MGLAETYLNLPVLLALAFMFGFALHRGSICAVVATRDWIVHRRPGRFLGFIEAALWATLAFIALSAFPMRSPNWAGWGVLLLGACMFGAGAYINGACAFGTIGHLGNGELSFFSTLVGIYLGGGLADWLAFDAGAMWQTSTPILSALPAGVSLAALMGLRYGLGRGDKSDFFRVCLAMAAVGTIFAAIHVAVPSWSLSHVPQHLLGAVVVPLAVTACMIAGSMMSGILIGRRGSLRWPTLNDLIKRSVGGALMGAGASLVPGGNDALLLSGMPAGAPQAFIAYFAMIAAIAALIRILGSSAEVWSADGPRQGRADGEG